MLKCYRVDRGLRLKPGHMTSVLDSTAKQEANIQCPVCCWGGGGEDRG